MRKLLIFMPVAAVALAGCASRPLSMVGAVCTDRDGPGGLARICETATQVTVEQTTPAEAPIVARDPEPRLLGLTEGKTATRIIADARRAHGGSCSVDPKALRALLARYIARKLLADL